MPLKLMYITNNPQIAAIAQNCGVDRVFVDMEYIGKEARQGGLDTVKSHHTVEDVRRVRQVLNKSELLVRINPIHEASKEEIDNVVSAGADIIMLPMAKTAKEVETFVKFVNKRAKTMFLLETAEARENLKSILEVGGIDMVHIGLNDLHLAYKMKFMFELLSDGTVEEICNIISSYNIPYGFGGIARIGFGMLPAEYVITEHYRLGSSMAILSRSFCDIYKMNDMEKIESLFKEEMLKIRNFEKDLLKKDRSYFYQNQKETIQRVKAITDKID